jgi:hypothetical protein
MQHLAGTKRRWLALMCLALAWAMANWGCLVLQRALYGVWFAAYWLVCLALALAAIGFALSDLLASWRAYRVEKDRCLRQQNDDGENGSSDVRADD